MQQNTIAPQAAQLGSQIIAAVMAVMDDPEGAREAMLAHTEAQKLSDEQVDKLEKDREFMAHADAEREALDKLRDELSAQKVRQDEIDGKLTRAYDIHTKNVESLADSVKLHTADLNQHDKDRKQFEAQKKAFANEYKELLDAREQNRKWEADLTKREQALQRAAESVGWKSAAKG